MNGFGPPRPSLTNANGTEVVQFLDNTGIAEKDLVHDDLMSVFLVIRHGTPAHPSSVNFGYCPSLLSHKTCAQPVHIRGAHRVEVSRDWQFCRA